MNFLEAMTERAEWTIRKFNDQRTHRGGGDPFEISKFRGNLLLNEGINHLWILTCSGPDANPIYGTGSYLGVGTSVVAAAASQVGLQATGSNQFYEAVDSGYPTFGSSQKATWRATFESGDANFSWQEFSVSNATGDSGQNLNRKVSDQGTKAAGQVWELTLDVTLS